MKAVALSHSEESISIFRDKVNRRIKAMALVVSNLQGDFKQVTRLRLRVMVTRDLPMKQQFNTEKQETVEFVRFVCPRPYGKHTAAVLCKLYRVRTMAGLPGWSICPLQAFGYAKNTSEMVALAHPQFGDIMPRHRERGDKITPVIKQGVQSIMSMLDSGRLEVCATRLGGTFLSIACFNVPELKLIRTLMPPQACTHFHTQLCIIHLLQELEKAFTSHGGTVTMRQFVALLRQHVPQLVASMDELVLTSVLRDLFQQVPRRPIPKPYSAHCGYSYIGSIRLPSATHSAQRISPHPHTVCTSHTTQRTPHLRNPFSKSQSMASRTPQVSFCFQIICTRLTWMGTTPWPGRSSPLLPLRRA